MNGNRPGAMSLLDKYAQINANIEEARRRVTATRSELESTNQSIENLRDEREGMLQETAVAKQESARFEEQLKGDKIERNAKLEEKERVEREHRLAKRERNDTRRQIDRERLAFLERCREFRSSCKRMRVAATILVLDGGGAFDIQGGLSENDVWRRLQEEDLESSDEEGDADGKSGSSKSEASQNGSSVTDFNTPGKTSPRTSHMTSKSQQKETSASIDLFFDLPARVISKLFRPKLPLCGQPLTLNVSGTTFCCRAELFDNSQACPSTVGDDAPEHPLVLFSVIVALAPLTSNPSTPSTVKGSPSAKSPRSAHNHHSNHSTNINITTDKNRRDDSTFTTIKLIHHNLARLCMVLTREERRNQYVTLQCQMLLSIRKEYEDRFLPTSGGKSSVNDADQSNSVKPYDSVSNSTRRISNTSLSNVGIITKDKRSTGPPTGPTNTTESKASGIDKKSMSAGERREYIQQVIELMFATSHPKNHGNLARELAEVFHFLSKHDDPTCPITASATLSRASGREGVIYINRHVAVQLDSVGSPQNEHNNLIPKIFQDKGDLVNPHLTLLFPNLSPSEIIRGISEEPSLSLSSSSSGTDISASVSMSQSIRRVLSQLHPRKSLKDVALDSALSLQRVLEAAKWLVDAGMCVTAMPVTRKSRYVCVDGVIDKMRALSLPFWQAFSSRSRNIKFHFGSEAKRSAVTGAPHIFMIVSALTSNPMGSAAAPRLGDAIDFLTDAPGNDQDSGAPYLWREKDSPSPNPFRFERPLSVGSVGTTQQDDSTPEYVLYSMAIWLVANGVITQVGQ